MRKFKTKFLLLLFIFSAALMVTAHAQTITVNGSVSDDKGQKLGGASVVIANSNRGTVSDAKGNFSLSVAQGTELVVTLIGYDTVSVTAQPTVAVTLRRADNTLADVVIIGYGTTKKKELTGAVATVNAKDFQKGAITTPEQLIAGKVAGVSVTSNSGSPGAGSTIRIRGGASLNASNDPLIVVDGVPLSGNNIYGASNPLSLINPNDIETFTVLKDAASTAIYGSRASNGVILITTKKGSAGGTKPVISFNTQLSVASLVKKMNVQSADAFRQYVDSFGHAGATDYRKLLGSANTDWQDEIFRNAVSTDNNISISGNQFNTPYRVSFGYLNQNGILKTDNLERFSGGISVTPSFLSNRLKTEINIKGAVSNARFANNAAISSAVYFDPTQPVHAQNQFGNYYEWTTADPASPLPVLNKLAPRNPVALLDLYNNNSHVKRSIGNIRLDYSMPFLPELHANLNLGYDIAKGEGNIDVPAYAAQNFLDGGQKNRYGNKMENKVSEFYLSYIKDLKKIKSNINAVAGYGYYNNRSTNYDYGNLKANGDTITTAKPVDKPENTLLSYYGRFIYTYNTKYILSASLRTDASSKFSSENRWGTYPAVAASWRMKRESFLMNAKALSDLTLRLSYGITGNQDGIGNYPYQAVYSPSLQQNGALVQFGNTFYQMGTPSAYDANIKWEQTASTNAGLDYGFLNNRITGSLDFYYKKTKDLLNIIPIPAGSNFGSRILTNIGNVENRGVEFLINADIVRGKKFSWSASFNGTYNENKVLKLTANNDPSFKGTETAGGIQIQTVGHELNSFYVYKQEYLNGKPVEGVYADLNGDGIINENDKYRYKSPFPKYIFGFSTQFSYLKWTLSTVLRANTGNYMYNGITTGAIRANILNPLGYLAGSLNDVYNTGFINGQNQSDYYIQNASFLKMDNLGLAYNIGRVWKNKAGMQISANCQNVFTVTKYKGIDPEIYGGIDNTIYPRPRTFVLGVNLLF